MKVYKIFLPVFMVLVLMLSFINPIIATCESISNKVLRLHILANSDTAEDQNIKLKLKNYFLENTSQLFTGENVEQNIEIAKQNTDYIEQLCNEFLAKNGYAYQSSVTVVKEYFDTRVYDDFTLPAGVYNSIKIEIGEGKGHNWWCIVFPSVCLSACSTSMSEYLTEEEMQLINDGYTPKFKIVEIYEKLKNKVSL